MILVLNETVIDAMHKNESMYTYTTSWKTIPTKLFLYDYGYRYKLDYFKLFYFGYV